MEELRQTTNDKRRTVCILGSYGEGNVGDEAILDGLLVDARTSIPNAQIIVFSHNPSETLAQHPGVIAYPVLPAGMRSFLKQSLTAELHRSMYALKAADDILIGGGGIFYDNGFSKGKNPIEVWHTRCKTILRLGKEYRIYGVSIGPITRETSRKWLYEIADRAKSIAVRDEASKKLLVDLGIKKQISVVKDPALSLTAPKHSQGSLRHSPRLGVAIRRWYLDDVKKMNQFRDQLALIISGLARNCNADITLIPFSTGNDDDRVWMQEIMEKITARPDQVHISDKPHTVAGRMQEIANVDVLIGMRLHSLIFAHLSGTPWVGLTYSEKVRAFTASIGEENMTVSLEEATSEKVGVLVKSLL